MNNHIPKISVIVPVYNVEQYLPRCIESVQAQSFEDFELLLIDDGSQDNSGKICDDYAQRDNRIRVFHKENGGVSSARNLGIDNAKGEYISFIDSDDEVVDTYLEVLYYHICKSDIVFFPSIWINEDHSRMILLFDDFFSNAVSSIEEEILLLMHNKSNFDLFGFTWNKIFKSNIIKENNLRFINNLAIREDEIFTLDYCRFIKSMKVIQAPVYYYYRMSSGLTYKEKNSKEWLLLASCYQKLLLDFKSEELKRHIKKNVVSCMLCAILYTHIYNTQLYKICFTIVKYCRKNKMSIPYKSIMKILLQNRL